MKKNYKTEEIFNILRQVEDIFRQGQTTRVAVRGAEKKRKPIRVEDGIFYAATGRLLVL